MGEELKARKPCPNCDGQMQYLFSWIEHGGIGHPGFPIAWICMKCNHREKIELEFPKVTNE